MEVHVKATTLAPRGTYSDGIIYLRDSNSPKNYPASYHEFKTIPAFSGSVLLERMLVQCRPKNLVRKIGKIRMDELDRKIINLLERNGRASNARIARDVGVSEGTVRRRLKRLISERIINIIALPDPRKLGYNSEALIGVQVDPDKVDDVATKMAKLEYTRWVTITTGTYDVFAWATLQNAESLGRFLRDEVGGIDGVRRTETFVNLQVMKREFGIPA